MLAFLARAPRSRAPLLAFACLLGIAFAAAVYTTRGLVIPYSYDFHRDTAFALAIEHGHFGSDAYYRGETMWYNPLVAGVEALVSAVALAPVRVVIMHAGPYLNLPSAVLFFVLVARLFDRWTALASSAAFLFVTSGRFRESMSATYSPWPYASTVMLAGFFLLLLLYLELERGRSPWWRSALLGLVLGFVFWGHTGPALVFGCVLTARTAERVWRARRGDGWRRPAVEYAAVVAFAFAAASPVVVPLMSRYHLRMVNPMPGAWISPLLSARRLPELLVAGANGGSLVGACGALLLFRRPRASVGEKLLRYWVATTALFLAYSYVRQPLARHGLVLPSVIPSIHYFIYLETALSVLFGYALRTGFLAWRARRSRGLSSVASARDRRRFARVLPATAGLAMALVHLPAYADRPMFGFARSESFRRAAMTGRIAAWQYIEAHATFDDVFLASPELAMFVVAPAGSRVVVTDEDHSNPYLDWHARGRDQGAMLAALAAHAYDEYAPLAKRYGVTHAIFEGEVPAGIDDGTVCRRVFERDGVSVYRVDPAQLR